MEKTLLTHTLRNLMKEIESSIKQLNAFMLNSTLLDAVVFDLPRIKKGDEDKPITEIPVVKYEGKEALSMATEFFLQFYAEDKFVSTKSIAKMPGVISLEVLSPIPVIKQIEQINQLKDDFHTAAKTIKNTTNRAEFLHDAFQDLIALQLYRHIHFFAEPINTITFTWAQRSLMDKVSKKQLICKLEKLKLAQPPEYKTYNEVSWSQRVNNEIDQVKTFPENIELRQRRELKVTPRANVLLQPSNKTQSRNDIKRQKDAHSPIILLNAGVPKTGDLKDFFERPRQTKIVRKTVDSPIVSLGHINVFEIRK